MDYRNALGLVLAGIFSAASPSAFSADQSDPANEQTNPTQHGSAVIDADGRDADASFDEARGDFDEGLDDTEQPIRPGQMEQDADLDEEDFAKDDLDEEGSNERGTNEK
ncbi:hypothetical protein R5M92_15010 [Halomonas sp. Bachu 37]|uniref:hypothetical protein n=1 Tax=Halomonas kashgarensis TaxID=3084920 RepID=UPI003216BF01